MAADMCVAVLKYSHATGVLPDNSIPWTHIVASNVYLVIKGEDTDIRNGQLYLQLVQGNTALETIDVGELVDRALDARQGSQRAGIMPQIEQLPIFGICKEVFLALRYRKPDGQARRVQFRMQSATECARAVAILEQRGMEFQQQRPRTGRPGTARPDTATSEMRPLTSQTSSFSTTGTFKAPAALVKQSPFQMQALEVGGLSSQSSRAPPRQSSQSQVGHVGSSTAHGPNESAEHTMPAPTLLRSTTISAKPHHDANSLRRPGAPGVTADDLVSPKRISSVPPEASLDRELVGSTREPLSSGQSASYNQYGSERPLPVAMLSMPETLEHEMPPRRELPFKRPGSHQSTSSRPSTTSKSVTHSAAVGGSSELTATSSLLSPAKPASANRPVTTSSLKRTAGSAVQEPIKKYLAVEARPQSRPSSHGINSSSIRMAPPESNFRRPSDLGELLRSTKPLVGRSSNSNKVTRQDSTADAQYEIETPPGTAGSPTKTVGLAVSSPMRSDGQNPPASPLRHAEVNHPMLAKTSSATATPLEDTEITSLADYASQSREDRQTVLDEFMVSKLEDANFAILCEDLDSCWRRIALGL